MKRFFLGASLLIATLPVPAVFAQTVELGAPFTVKEPPKKLGTPPPSFIQETKELLLRTQNMPLVGEKKTTQLTFRDFTVDLSQGRTGDPIQGTFILENSSAWPVFGVRYVVSLAAVTNVTRPSYFPKSVPLQNAPYAYTRAAEIISTETINVQADGRIAKTFSIPTRRDFTSGAYFVWVTAYPERGEPFFSSEARVTLDGTNKNDPIALSPAFYEQRYPDGTDYVYAANPLPLSANTSPKIFFNIKNLLDKLPPIRTHVEIRSHTPAGAIVKEFTNSVNLKKGEQSLSLALPRMDKPGRYFGRVLFMSENNDAPFRIAPFAFIQKGDAAEITEIYQEGNKLVVEVSGSFYPNTTLGNVSVSLAVRNLETDKTSGELVQTIDLPKNEGLTPKKTVAFALTDVPAYPRFEVSIKKGAAMLDMRAFAPNGTPPPPPVTTPAPKESYWYLTLGIILAALLGAWYFIRKRKISVSSLGMMILLLSAGMFALMTSFAHAQLVFNSPAPNSAFEMGKPILIQADIYDGRFNGGTQEPPCNRADWPYDNQAFAIISDAPPRNQAGLFVPLANAEQAVNREFAGMNYRYLGNLTTAGRSGYQGKPINCQTWRWGNITQAVNAPESGTKGSFIGSSNLSMYVVWNAVGWRVISIPIEITPLSYVINTSPGNITVGIGQTAEYTAKIVPRLNSFVQSPRPAIFDWEAPYPLPTGNYWDNPQWNNGYRPGDTIKFNVSRMSPGFGIGTNQCSRISGFGSAYAMVVLSDGTPKNPATLSYTNIAEQFADTNYRNLGGLNSSVQLGYSRDCTIWFTGTAWGEKIIPKSGQVCTQNGKLNEFDGKKVNAYVIFAGDAGSSFVAHQQIRIGKNESPEPPLLTSVFNEPITLSRTDLTQCAGGAMNPDSCNGEKLRGDLFDVSYDPSNAFAQIDSKTNFYNEVKVRITPRERGEPVVGCPYFPFFGALPFEFNNACYDATDGGSYGPTLPLKKCPFGTNYYVGSNFGPEGCYVPIAYGGGYAGPAGENLVTLIRPSGTYKFKITGISQSGIREQSADPYITIIANPTPPPFDNLRLNGNGSCKSVPLAWDRSNNPNVTYDVHRVSGSGATYKDESIATGLPNPPDPTVTYTDNTARENTLSTYYIKANLNAGNAESNSLMVRTPICQTACNGGQDIGLKMREAGQNVNIAAGPAGNSPLRIRKGGTTYGIVLVDPADPNASKIRIKTSSGIKALCKLP